MGSITDTKTILFMGGDILKTKTTEEFRAEVSKYRDSDPRGAEIRKELDRRALGSLFSGMGIAGPYFKGDK